MSLWVDAEPVAWRRGACRLCLDEVMVTDQLDFWPILTLRWWQLSNNQLTSVPAAIGELTLLEWLTVRK